MLVVTTLAPVYPPADRLKVSTTVATWKLVNRLNLNIIRFHTIATDFDKSHVTTYRVRFRRKPTLTLFVTRD